MKLTHAPAVALAILFPLALTACGSSGSGGPYGSSSQSTPAAAAQNSTPAAAALVITGSATVSGASKTVLTNSAGMTLYYRASDSSTTVTCTGACANNWPPLLLASGDPTGAASLTGKLSVYMGANGRQVLYNGHPLYRFANDTAAGDAKGEGLANVWHVATPDLAQGM